MTENPAAHERSGADVVEAVGAAEHDSALHETHTHPEQNKPGESYVERAQGDPAMTEPASDEEPQSAAAAQAQRGARVSDRLAAGEDPPSL
ncbi:hypothetical protein [Cryptosporangium phraense]|uniref:Uncharacterized protein n=1 Tax=Cryptosporangium phraense TaxID=2593070 RepID=A0A545AIE2_9ACTN|nr:hypothetical protein [Cryptosporangium phraense]TQS41083.1 hypothetical protein FL583_31475 [Cryptosporangium phraense]